MAASYFINTWQSTKNHFCTSSCFYMCLQDHIFALMTHTRKVKTIPAELSQLVIIMEQEHCIQLSTCLALYVGLQPAERVLTCSLWVLYLFDIVLSHIHWDSTDTFSHTHRPSHPQVSLQGYTGPVSISTIIINNNYASGIILPIIFLINCLVHEMSDNTKIKKKQKLS